MISVANVTSYCLCCVHLIDHVSPRCKAFPDGIPQALWYAKKSHSEPIEGDHGIQYERDEALIAEVKRLREEMQKPAKVSESSPDPMLLVLESAQSMEQARKMIAEISTKET